MTREGVKRALAIVQAAYSSYSSCRQYREDIENARASSGEHAPIVDKVRAFFNHPEFIAANAERVREALDRFSAQDDNRELLVAFTAHSIPVSMAQTCDYAQQIQETCRLVAERSGIAPERWSLVYQSRSGRPEDPWLGPDILDQLRDLNRPAAARVLIHPIGFLSDHLEVLYDLDVEAKALCEQLGIEMVRSRTVGTHPRFVQMLRALVQERIAPLPERSKASIGQFAPGHDVCPHNCCPAPTRRPAGPRADAGSPAS
jgi:ferrochelatase